MRRMGVSALLALSLIGGAAAHQLDEYLQATPGATVAGRDRDAAGGPDGGAYLQSETQPEIIQFLHELATAMRPGSIMIASSRNEAHKNAWH
jgi:hypothetical protein